MISCCKCFYHHLLQMECSIVDRYDDKCNLEIDGKLYSIIGGKYDSVFLFTERINFIHLCIKKGHIKNYNELANCHINKVLYNCHYTKEMEDQINEIKK